MWTCFLGSITTWIEDKWHEIVSLHVPFPSLWMTDYTELVLQQEIKLTVFETESKETNFYWAVCSFFKKQFPLLANLALWLTLSTVVCWRVGSLFFYILLFFSTILFFMDAINPSISWYPRSCSGRIFLSPFGLLMSWFLLFTSLSPWGSRLGNRRE